MLCRYKIITKHFTFRSGQKSLTDKYVILNPNPIRNLEQIIFVYGLYTVHHIMIHILIEFGCDATQYRVGKMVTRCEPKW